MKKIILIPSTSDVNRGDQALIWESIRVIQEVYEGFTYDIKLISPSEREMNAGAVRQTVDSFGLEYIDPILKHPNRFFNRRAENNVDYGFIGYLEFGLIALTDLLRSIFLIVPFHFINKIGLCLYSVKAKESYNLFRDSDAVFVKGGGFIHSYGGLSDFYRLYYLLFLVLISIRFKKKIFVLPNSIGPLRNKLAYFLVKRVLKKCTMITVRESISENFVSKNLSLPVKAFYDFGYYLTQNINFDPKKYLDKRISSNKQIVGITLRPDRTLLRPGNSSKYDNYIQSFVDLVKYLNNKNFHVCFFAHTLGPSANENDSLAIQAVIQALPRHSDFSYIIDPTLSCKETMMLYSQCYYFIGTRFHSVIFAQNMGVPTIAISYGGNKGEGIMRDLGLSEFVIQMSDISSKKLIDVFDKLVQQKDSYVELLNKHKKLITSNRISLIDEIRTMID